MSDFNLRYNKTYETVQRLTWTGWKEYKIPGPWILEIKTELGVWVPVPLHRDLPE